MNRIAPGTPHESNINGSNSPNSVKLGSHVCRKSLRILGRPISGSLSFIFLTYSAAVLICCLQKIVFLFINWDITALRFKALENLNVSVLVLSILVEFGIYLKRVEILMNIIDVPIFEYQMPLSEDMKKVKQEACNKGVSIQNQTSSLVFLYHFVTFTIPVIYSISQILFVNDVKFDELPLIYVYWLPVSMDNAVIYSIHLFIQNLDGIVLCVGYTGWFVLYLSAIVHTQHEVQILCLYLREMDERLISEDYSMKSLTERKEQFGENISNRELAEQNGRLKFYLNQLCKHHTAIIQAVKLVNDNGSAMLYVYQQMVCFELCIHMFLYLKNEGVERYQNLVIALVILLLISNIGIFGQGLVDESDKLTRELSQCSWIDKPTWFKKSLRLMMMTAIHRPLKIEPVGLFVINLQNVSRMIQAAYSYFNVMRTVKYK